MVDATHAEIDGPALVAVIVMGDERLIAVSGHRTMRGTFAVTPNDRWHIGSISKMMTSALVARLVDKGLLDWEMTVEEAFGEVEPNIHPQYRSATLIDFLSHRSGMSLASDEFSTRMSMMTARYLDQHGAKGPTPPGFKDGDFVGDPRIDRLHWTQAALQEAPVAPLGGPKRRYENGNYVVVASWLELLLDVSFEELMRTALFAPLGMENAGFGPPGTIGAITDPIGHQRGPDGSIRMFPPEGPSRPDNPPVLSPSGRVHVSPTDIALFMQDQIAGAQGRQGLLQPETYTVLHSPPFGDDYALGWIVRDSGGLGHGGTNGKWLALLEIRPSQNIGVFVATNLGPPKETSDALSTLTADLFDLATIENSSGRLNAHSSKDR